ncbi:MAG: YMGG-like glycine zipper-containing protein, partial [Planctomycetota bacterium]
AFSPTRTPGSPAPPNPARPGAPIYRSVAEHTDAAAGGVVEAPAQQVSYGVNPYDIYGAPPPTRRRGAPPSFPVNTAIGAGVGAVLGHQRGRRDEGALWGAGIGLLFDLARWSR